VKILHVISSGGMYGAEAVILNLSRTLNRQGHTSMLGIFSNTANPNLQLHECALQEGIESHLISCRGQIDRAVPASIRALAASTGADLIHAHGYKADVYVHLAMRGTGTAVVSTCHNWLDDSGLVWMYGVVDRLVLRRYKAVVAVSEEVKRRLIGSGVSPAKVHFIRNGIDLRPFEAAVPSLRDPGAAPEILWVGWVGRLSREKGPGIFLRAVANVHVEFPDARFMLVGEGPDRIKIERLIGELGIGDRVQLLGRRADMPAVYASFDVMVSSSLREGLPMAILEGMASGLPWVATSVGDVPTVVRDGETGILVPAEDVERLAVAVGDLLRNAEERARMGGAARRLMVSEFSAERMAREYLRVYRASAAHDVELEAGIENAASGGTH
jgi:glycosyltransferase involved in cell wall biosynthesis